MAKLTIRFRYVLSEVMRTFIFLTRSRPTTYYLSVAWFYVIFGRRGAVGISV